jgi:hypothetical protein
LSRQGRQERQETSNKKNGRRKLAELLCFLMMFDFKFFPLGALGG